MIYTVENIYHLIQRIKNNPNRLIVLKCYMTWCGFCRNIENEYKEMAKRNPNVIFLEVNMEHDKANGGMIANNYEVTGYPTFVLIKDEEDVGKIVGADMQRLQDMIYTHV